MSARKVWRTVVSAFKAELTKPDKKRNPWPRCGVCFRRVDPMLLCTRCGACDHPCCLKCDTCNRCTLACQGTCKEEK